MVRTLYCKAVVQCTHQLMRELSVERQYKTVYRTIIMHYSTRYDGTRYDGTRYNGVLYLLHL